MKHWIERIGWLIGFAVIAFVFWNLGKWIAASQFPFPELNKPVFVNELYPLRYPKFIDKPSFIDRIKWKTKRPYIVMPADPIENIADYWLALSLTKKGDQVQIVCVKNDSFFVQRFKGIGEDFTWWAGQTYMRSYIVEHRWRNPVRWCGVVVGARSDYSGTIEVTPYIETGASLWRIYGVIGADKEKVYGKVELRLW